MKYNFTRRMVTCWPMPPVEIPTSPPPNWGRRAAADAHVVGGARSATYSVKQYKLFISKALRYGPCVTSGSHSFTCHPYTNHTCLYSPAARRHRPLAGTQYSVGYRVQTQYSGGSLEFVKSGHGGEDSFLPSSFFHFPISFLSSPIFAFPFSSPLPYLFASLYEYDTLCLYVSDAAFYSRDHSS